MSPLHLPGKGGAGRRSPRARRVRRWLPRGILAAGLVLATAGCNANTVEQLGLRSPVTSQAKLIVDLWKGAWVAALIVGIIVWGGILWAVIFHRRRGDGLPHQVRYNLPIEMLYTVVPFIMVGVLFYFTARDENRVNSTAAHADVVVNVTGFQWSWQFAYPQYKLGNTDKVVSETGPMWNGKGGAASNCQITGTAGEVGAQQNCQLPLLEIPDHETVRFNLTSNDVVHAFWVLPFDFKRDVIPDRPNHFEVTPTSTLYSGPDTIGRCSELCGLYHSRMLFQIKIVTPAQFRAWIASQQHLQTVSGSAQ